MRINRNLNYFLTFAPFFSILRTLYIISVKVIFKRFMENASYTHYYLFRINVMHFFSSAFGARTLLLTNEIAFSRNMKFIIWHVTFNAAIFEKHELYIYSYISI